MHPFHAPSTSAPSPDATASRISPKVRGNATSPVRLSSRR